MCARAHSCVSILFMIKCYRSIHVIGNVFSCSVSLCASKYQTKVLIIRNFLTEEETDSVLVLIHFYWIDIMYFSDLC